MESSRSLARRLQFVPNLMRLRPYFLLPVALLIAVPFTRAATPLPEHLSLADAIKLALAKNYTLQAEAFSVSIANAQVTEQLGTFDPKLTYRYSHGENEQPLLADPVTGLRPAAQVSRDDSYSLGVGGLLPWGMSYSLTATSDNARSTVNNFADNFASFAGVTGRQPLLRDGGFGAGTAQIRIALTNRSISEWQFRQAVIDTITQVIGAYYELDFAQAQDRAAQRSRDAMARLVEENEKRHAAGSMSEFDVTQAKARLAMQGESVLFTAKAVHDAENALKALISDDRTTSLLDWHVSVDPFPAAAASSGADAALDFAVALKKRPDYQQASATLKRNDINFRYQRNQLLPRVDLVGSYGYNGYDAADSVSRRMVRNEDYRAYTYGVEVSIPLTFTSERGRYRAAKSQLRQAETYLQKLEQDIVVSVGNAANQIETARQRVIATREARELQEQTLEAETKRLRAGTGSTFFVLQEQQILASLEVSEARALADYHRSVAEYDRQIGVTLEKQNIALTMPK